MEHENPIILVVDDEQAILSSMSSILSDEGYVVETTAKPENVINLIGQIIPDFIFLDIFMPNFNGLEILAQIKREFPDQKVIVISGYGNITLAVEALKKGASDFLEKPFSIEDLLSKIEQLKLQGAKKSFENVTQPTNTKEATLVGESYLFKELIQYTNRVIPLSTHTLIYGPRGVGKTTLAKYMHNQKNKDLDITVINGNESDCIAKNESSFKQAGTIIIKHVDRLATSQQQKLLDALESETTEARVISLTDKSLYDLSIQHLFNESLFFALSATPIEIPSLNKRRFDIPLLAHYFLSEINKTNKEQIEFTAPAIRLLRNYIWQENIRELQILINQAALNSKSNATLDVEDLQSLLSETKRDFIEEQRFQFFSSLDEATHSFQKKFLLYQLKKSRYDINQLSDALSMEPQELKTKILGLGIAL